MTARVAPFYVSRYFLRVRDSSGATLGVRSVALLHLGLLPEITKEGKKGGNLNRSTFFEKVPEYYSGVMDKEKQEITQ